MKRKTFGIGAGVAAVAVVVWYGWRGLEDPVAGAGRAVSKGAVAGKAVVRAELSGTAERWPEFGSPDFGRVARERAEAWLASRGRDAAGLVGAWDLTGDEALLMEAAERFPGDPRVCVAMIWKLLGNGEDAAEWVDRLVTAEPQNPGALYLRAAAQHKAGASKEAMATLRGAVALSGKLDLHLRDRMVTVREAALASGAGVKDAAMLSIFGPLSRGGGAPYLNGGHRAVAEGIKAAVAAGDTEEVVALAGISLGMANQMAAAPAPNLMDQMVENEWRRSTLKAMSGETEYGNSGTTVAQQLERVEAKRSEVVAVVGALSRIGDWLPRASEAEVASYADTFLLRGELEAMKMITAAGEKWGPGR
jgi:hypothetical protein